MLAFSPDGAALYTLDGTTVEVRDGHTLSVTRRLDAPAVTSRRRSGGRAALRRRGDANNRLVGPGWGARGTRCLTSCRRRPGPKTARSGHRRAAPERCFTSGVRRRRGGLRARGRVRRCRDPEGGRLVERRATRRGAHRRCRRRQPGRRGRQRHVRHGARVDWPLGRLRSTGGWPSATTVSASASPESWRRTINRRRRGRRHRQRADTGLGGDRRVRGQFRDVVGRGRVGYEYYVDVDHLVRGIQVVDVLSGRVALDLKPSSLRAERGLRRDAGSFSPGGEASRSAMRERPDHLSVGGRHKERAITAPDGTVPSWPALSADWSLAAGLYDRDGHSRFQVWQVDGAVDDNETPSSVWNSPAFDATRSIVGTCAIRQRTRTTNVLAGSDVATGTKLRRFPEDVPPGVMCRTACVC